MLAQAPHERPVTPTLRTSSYTIYVELENNRDSVLLVHGYSSAFDLVSRRVAAYLRSLETSRAPKPLYGEWSDDSASAGTPAEAPAPATLALLKRRGYLTAMTVPEEEAFFSGHASALHAAANLTMPTYVVMPTYDCNLRCGYCFQDHMRTNPAFSHLLGVMTPAMVDRIAVALPQFESRHGIESDSGASRPFVFFGGEPLFAQSLPIITYFMERMRAAGPATFAAVTNGTQLDAFAHLLGPGKIEALQITLDGPPARHDTRRIHADGSGSFDAIARNVSLALEYGVEVDIRMNVDRANISDLPQLAAVFADRGWTAFKNFSSHAEPVTDSSFKAPGRRAQLFNSLELREALAELGRTNAAMEAIGTHDDALSARALRVLGKGGAQTLPMTATFCGAHTGMYILDSFGDVYACWERTGDRNIRIGWIDEAGTLNFVGERLQNWRGRTVVSNPTCQRCRFALFCGGGCAVLAEGANGKTMHANYCDAFGKRFRLTLGAAYEQHVAGAASPVASAGR